MATASKSGAQTRIGYVYITMPVEMPIDATHYTGTITDEPTWWRWKRNSTGAIYGWQYWSEHRAEWMLHGVRAPHTLKSIPFVDGVPTFKGEQP